MSNQHSSQIQQKVDSSKSSVNNPWTLACIEKANMRVRAYVPTELIIQQGSWTPFGAPKGCGFSFDQIDIWVDPIFQSHLLLLWMWYGVCACISWRFVDYLFLNSFQGRPHVVCTGVLRWSHYLLSMLPLSPTNLVHRFPTTNQFTRIKRVITYECTSHSIQHTSPQIVRNMQNIIILDWIATGACFQDPELV